MSHLAVSIFDTSFQSTDIGLRIKRNTSIYAARVKFIKVGTLIDGNLNVKLMQGSAVLAEDTISYTQLNELGTNVYGFVKFDFDEAVSVNLKDGETQDLILRVTMDDITPSTSNYVGLIREYEAPIADQYGTSLPDTEGWTNSYGVEIYSSQR